MKNNIILISTLLPFSFKKRYNILSNKKKVVVLIDALPFIHIKTFIICFLNFLNLRMFGFKKIKFLRIKELNINQQIDVLFVCGGNTFRLLNQINLNYGYKKITYLLNNGVIYIGQSAGVIILSPSIDIVRFVNPDANRVGLKDFTALNLIKETVVPHYASRFEKSISNYERDNFIKTIRLKDGDFFITSSIN